MNEDLIKFDLENFTEEEFCSKYGIEEKILKRIWRSIHQIRDDYGSYKYDEYTKLVINYIKDLQMTELEKELNNFLNNELDFDNCYKTIEKYNDNYDSPLTKIYISGFYERLSIKQLIKIENFLKEKLNVEKIYIDVCDVDAGYAISWD